MATIQLRDPLKRLAGGRAEHPVQGATVGETLGELEREHPPLAGWILDERGQIRRHINVFVNGELGDGETAVQEDDKVHILPAISGGSTSGPRVTEVLAGTKKGLFAFEDGDGDPQAPFELKARAFGGDPVEYATRDPRSGRVLASVTSPFYGPKIWYADDLAGEWEQASGVALPGGEDAVLARVWTLVAGEQDGLVYAGGDPGVLFESRDGGATWSVNEALWEHPTRPSWTPGGGGLCIHSIVPWPGDPDRLALGISAAGVWLTEDGGATWGRGNDGIVAGYLPPEARAHSSDLCIHNIQRSAARPQRLFMQFHGGVYRSDDAGRTWTDIAAGLPGDFGFPLAVDPVDPDSAYVIPLVADKDRVTVDGRVRVYETRDAGASWGARGDGLPQEHAYLTVLRGAFATAGEGASLELYLGTTSGHVFGSRDAGASWFTVASYLPTVHSVVASC